MADWNIPMPGPTVPRMAEMPRAKGFKAWLGRLYLRLGGWTLVGAPPASPKYVIVGAPHTSNWDGAVMVAISFATGIPFRWTGKDSLFRPPLGRLMRYLGGIPIDRSAPQGLVAQIAEAFQRRDELALIVTPEGTRGKAPYWRTGFYYIALEAGVPLVIGTGDFATRKAGFGLAFMPTGDIKGDLARIRAFLQHVTPKRPENVGPVALKEPSPPREKAGSGIEETEQRGNEA